MPGTTSSPPTRPRRPTAPSRLKSSGRTAIGTTPRRCGASQGGGSGTERLRVAPGRPRARWRQPRPRSSCRPPPDLGLVGLGLRCWRSGPAWIAAAARTCGSRRRLARALGPPPPPAPALGRDRRRCAPSRPRGDDALALTHGRPAPPSRAVDGDRSRPAHPGHSGDHVRALTDRLDVVRSRHGPGRPRVRRKPPAAGVPGTRRTRPVGNRWPRRSRSPSSTPVAVWTIWQPLPSDKASRALTSDRPAGEQHSRGGGGAQEHETAPPPEAALLSL